MNKEQIKALISAKIAGQGNQVDSGGALDEILNAIVDAIPEGGGGVPEPVSGIIIEGGSAMATLEQRAQIKSNCLAGQNTILSTANKEYTVMLFNGEPVVLVPDEEAENVVRSWGLEEA